MRYGTDHGRAGVLVLLLSASGPAAAGSLETGGGRDFLLGPLDGERLAFSWEFFYEWQGPDGSSIIWEVEYNGMNMIALTAVYSSLTGTWGIGGEGVIPAIVKSVTPYGTMIGSGSTTIDVGGSYDNGLVRLTIMETTGGSYTITVGEYTMTAATPEYLNTFEMVFNWDVAALLVDRGIIDTENGYVIGDLEVIDNLSPEVR